MPLVDQFTRLRGFADEARASGYGDDEIDGVVRQRMKASIDAGFSAGDVAKHLGAPEANAPTFFEGLKRAGQAGVQELGKTLLQTYKSLDPAQAGSMLEAGTAPLIAPLMGAAVPSIVAGEAARKGAEQFGASPEAQAWAGTIADFAVPSPFIPKGVRGVARAVTRPAQRTVSELLQNERAPVSRETPAPTAAVVPEAPIVEPKPAAPAAPVMPSIEERIRTLELQNAELRGKQQAELEARQVQVTPTPKPVEAPIVEAQPKQIAPEPPAPVIERPPAVDRIAAAQEAAPAKLAEMRAKPLKTNQMDAKVAADAKIREITDTPADLEYKGKTYTGAEKIAGNNVRLKDDPDKVVRGVNEILKVDEKVPFDVPTETANLEQIGISQRLKVQQQREAAAESINSYKKLLVTPKEDIPRAVDGLSPEQAKSALDNLNAAPGDNPTLRQALETKLSPRPAIQQTPAGAQAMIPGAEGRTVPNAPLRPRRAQTEKPMELEQPGIRAKEPGLFEKPIPSKNLAPEEIAAADEMTAMLGKSKPRKITDIIKSERGSIRLGPLRIRDGVPVESPTEREVREAVEQITKPTSAKRLTAGGLGEEATKTLSKTMGKEGAEMGRLSKAVRNDSELEAGQALQPLRAVFKGLSDQQKASLVEVLDKGTAPMDATTKAAAAQVRAALDKVADRAQQVNLQIRLPNGDKIPFQPRGNYFPHMFGKELGDVVRTEKGRAMAKAQIKAQMSAGGKEVTDAQVEKALQAMLKTSKTRYGHLEMARQFDFGDYSKDPAAVLSRYFGDAYRRINIAEKFGPDLETGETLLSNIGMNKGDNAESFARSYFKKVTSTEEPGNAVVKDAVNFATNFQAASKLGQAALSNISQPVYTAVVAGAKNAVKGYYKGFTKEGRAFAEKTGAILDDTLSDFMKDAGARSDDTLAGKAADKVLKWTGFTASERMNRIVSANAGRYFANETLEKLIKNPENKGLRRALEKMNINVDDAIGRGELTEVEQLKAGQSIVNRTQFKTDVTEIPLFWSSDAGRLITQFKKFQFKSGQMVKDEILGEMAKGNLKPFLRAAALLPIAGVGVAKLRDSVRFGEQTERKRNLADYLATVGTFGVFTDTFASSGRQPVRGLEYLAGPTLGDAGRGLEAIADLAAFMPGGQEGSARSTAKLISRQIPVVGPSVRQLFNEKKPKREDTKMLEELGLKRERSSNKKLMKELGLE